jgi:hypothetical protein
VPSEKISTNFPLLDDGNSSDHQEDGLSFAMNTPKRKIKQEVVFDDFDQNLLLEISRKEKYIDKYNSVVNDLEEILRSPIKSVNKLPPSTIMASPKRDSNESANQSPKKGSAKRTKRTRERSPEISLEEKRKLLAKSRSERLNRRNNLQSIFSDYDMKEAAPETKEYDFSERSKKSYSSESDDEYEWIEIKGRDKSDLSHNDQSLETETETFGQCAICKIGFNSKAELSSHVGIHF